MKKVIIVSTAILFGLTVCNTYAQTVSADFTKYLQAAEQGDMNAMAQVGYMYYTGKGVTKDFDKAFKWSTKAAEKGDASAMNYLGIMYSFGNGVAKSATKAVEWYTKSAEKGYSSAMSNLGSAYHNGEGVAKDDAKAIEWYTKAAEKGSTLAKENLVKIQSSSSSSSSSGSSSSSSGSGFFATFCKGTSKLILYADGTAEFVMRGQADRGTYVKKGNNTLVINIGGSAGTYDAEIVVRDSRRILIVDDYYKSRYVECD